MNAIYLALQDQALESQTRKLLLAADQELTRVAQFTAQTLRFHKQSNAPEPTDLAEIMDSVLAMYSARLRSSSIRVECDYRTTQKLHCFKSELRQVFANLVGNSLDALGQQGRLLIRIQAARSWIGSPVPGIRVVVADTGNGIPVELRARLFEPFVSTKEITGVGLGLWVSQSIVHKHGGRIVLRSRVGEKHHGTVFSLFFPTPDPA
jgi:signal transduction histidine kinase